MPTRFPLSPYQQLGGMVYLPRMLDKIRLRQRGELPPEYFANFGTAYDGRFCRFTRIDHAALCAEVATGKSDEDLLAWIHANGRDLNAEDILIWNAFLSKRGWRDEVSAELEDFKAASGLAHRKDLVTFFDYFEADEGRTPPK
jgi:Domain of unknown function (DUF5069)